MKVLIRCVLAVCLLVSLPAWSHAAAPDYRTWYLSEGSTTFFEEEILIGNPNTVDADVTVTYLVPPGTTAPAPWTGPVTAMSRKTIAVPSGYTSISAVVTSTQHIVVERSMYWGGTQRAGGHNSAGVLSPGLEWFFAEGANGIFDTYFLLANPGDTDATVELTFLGPSSETKVVNVPVPAHTRQSVNARVDAGVDWDKFSMRARSSVPFIAERAMYWGVAGTNESGLRSLNTTWRFGEGFTGSGFATYVLLGNPNDQPANVETTFYLEDGTTAVDTRTVPANSRVNIAVGDEVAGAAGKPFSIVVRSDVAIAAERAMYWGSFREGHVVAGIPDEAQTWAFAEGIEDRFAGLDYDTYFLLNNANSSLVTVKATFLLEDGSGFQDTFDIGANSRYTLIAARYPQLSNMRFAAFFEASGPIVAERSVYWGTNYWGGHASAGTPWYNAIPVPTKAVSGPTVTSITPTSDYTTGGADITIVGTNFRQDSTVTIGGASAVSVTVLDAQTLIARAPAASAGAKAVVVTSLGQAAANQPTFTYVTPPPPPPPVSSTAAQGQPVAVYCNSFNSSGVCTSVRTWPFPQNLYGVIAQLAAERRDLLVSSCTETGGNNRFMFEAVRRVRAATGSNRWGLNIKRGNQGLSQDIVTYFYGPEGTEMENDVRVYIFDIIGGHCGGNPGPNWEDVTDKTRAAGTIGRWTTAGQSF